MVLGIGVEQPPDHPLVLRVVFPRLGLEELDTAFAQRDRHLDPFIPKDQVRGTRKEVRNDLQLSQWLVRVPDALLHTWACPFASNRPRRFG